MADRNKSFPGVCRDGANECLPTIFRLVSIARLPGPNGRGENFSSIHFRNGEKGILKGGKKRTHQLLNLQSDFTKNYSSNAKRILKKSSGFVAENSTRPKVLIKLFNEHVAHKIETLSKKDVVILEQLMDKLISVKRGELILLKKEDEVVGRWFFYVR